MSEALLPDDLAINYSEACRPLVRPTTQEGLAKEFNNTFTAVATGGGSSAVIETGTFHVIRLPDGSWKLICEEDVVVTVTEALASPIAITLHDVIVAAATQAVDDSPAKEGLALSAFILEVDGAPVAAPATINRDAQPFLSWNGVDGYDMEFRVQYNTVTPWAWDEGNVTTQFLLFARGDAVIFNGDATVAAEIV